MVVVATTDLRDHEAAHPGTPEHAATAPAGRLSGLRSPSRLPRSAAPRSAAPRRSAIRSTATRVSGRPGRLCRGGAGRGGRALSWPAPRVAGLGDGRLGKRSVLGGVEDLADAVGSFRVAGPRAPPGRPVVGAAVDRGRGAL